ncbi:MAG: hypothetical protein QXL94_08915, partial [Candidatus Parvarchaeum sp.]
VSVTVADNLQVMRDGHEAQEINLAASDIKAMQYYDLNYSSFHDSAENLLSLVSILYNYSYSPVSRTDVRESQNLASLNASTWNSTGGVQLVKENDLNQLANDVSNSLSQFGIFFLVNVGNALLILLVLAIMFSYLYKEVKRELSALFKFRRVKIS